jgi:cytochrome c peroxidase
VVALGRRLFQDKRLSRDGTASCATCHDPALAFTDGRVVATGVGGATGTRNAPSLLNVAFQELLFWDGRRLTLEAQAADPFFNPRELGLTDPTELVGKLTADAAYRKAFQRAFGIASKEPTLAQVTQALAAFERTLIAADSPFDRFYYAKDERALSPAAQRGLRLFQGRAQCVTCHIIGTDGATFTDGKFHSAGIGVKRIEAKLGSLAIQIALASNAERDRLIVSDPEIAALGRFAVTRNPRDIGQYKTPSLRNVALTAPYMHDGSVATLREAVERELYYRSAQSTHPVVLTPTEQDDLIEFLRALTSSSWPLLHGASPASEQASRVKRGSMQ